MPVPRHLRLPAVAALLATAILAPATPAHAAATCSFDAAAARVAIAVTGADAAARISRAAGGAIQLDGAGCGAATVTNTDLIAITGDRGVQRVTIDLAGGALAPGKTPEAGAASEIEVTVDGVLGGEWPGGDEVRIAGGAAADAIGFRPDGIALNGDADPDVTTTGVEFWAGDGNGGNDRLLGGTTAAPLRLTGGAGNDELAGGSADDTLDGGPGSDRESGGGGADQFLQGRLANGRDVLDGGDSPYDRIDYSQRTGGVRIDSDDVANDGALGELDDVRDTAEYLVGGAGPDVIVASAKRYQPFQLIGNGGNDAITGGTYYDMLDGGAGNDTLDGLGGSDSFIGGPGDDVERGGDMPDIFHEGGTGGPNGADDIQGGAGVDHYFAPERTVGLTVTLADNAANDGAAGERDNVRSDIENVTGGAGNDRITGSPAPNSLTGNRGADTLTGGGGADVIYGYADADALDGGTEDDEVRGGDGDDRLKGGTGADRVHGDYGADILSEPAVVDGGDTLDGGYDADQVSYAARARAVRVTLDGTGDDGDAATGEGDNVAAEKVTGGTAADQLVGSGADEQLEGGAGTDDLEGAGGADRLAGGDGADDLSGGEGDDTLNGGFGADEVFGDGGVDAADYAGRTTAVRVTLNGSADDGGAGEGDDVRTEHVTGGGGADRLTGDAAANLLDGGAGDDVLDGGFGADRLTGGGGTDTATYAGRGLTVRVTLDGVADDGESKEADDVASTVENVVGGNGGDVLTGSATANVLTGGGGRDRLDGGAGGDVLDGGADYDVAEYGARTAPLTVTVDDRADDGTDADADGVGEEGDRVTETVEGLAGGKGDDRLTGGPGLNVLMGNDGHDVLAGGGEGAAAADGTDHYSGGAGTDTATFAHRSAALAVAIDDAANDGAKGAAERDNVQMDVENVVGGHGDDDIAARGDAANVLSGGPGGQDVLSGGPGDDRFDEGRNPADPGIDHDTFHGGEGTDVVDYSKRTRAVAVSIDDEADDGIPATSTTAPEADNVRTDVENVLGGANADLLTGSDANNRLDGGGNVDRLEGGGGDDTLLGGASVDRLFGQPGNDTLEGGPGNNGLYGGDGDDTIVEAATRSGNDVFDGGPGRDTLDYSARTVSVSLDNDGGSDDGQDADLDGTAEERDRIFTTVEILRGGRGNDRLTDAQPDDRICGRLDGHDGHDLLNGSSGVDVLLGGAGHDIVNGNDGYDYIVGGPGNDVERGGGETDIFIQSGITMDCADKVVRTEISGDDGADDIDGGDDHDVTEYHRTADTAVTVRIDTLANDGAAGEGDIVVTDGVQGGKGDDHIVGDSGRNTLYGREGDDLVDGWKGDDVVTDLSGTDRLLGGEGSDILRAADGEGGDSLDGGPGSDDGEWDPGDTRIALP